MTEGKKNKNKKKTSFVSVLLLFLSCCDSLPRCLFRRRRRGGGGVGLALLASFSSSSTFFRSVCFFSFCTAAAVVFIIIVPIIAVVAVVGRTRKVRRAVARDAVHLQDPRRGLSRGFDVKDDELVVVELEADELASVAPSDNDAGFVAVCAVAAVGAVALGRRRRCSFFPFPSSSSCFSSRSSDLRFPSLFLPLESLEEADERAEAVDRNAVDAVDLAVCRMFLYCFVFFVKRERVRELERKKTSSEK